MVRCTYNMYATEYNNHVEYNNTASAVYDIHNDAFHHAIDTLEEDDIQDIIDYIMINSDSLPNNMEYNTTYNTVFRNSE